MSSKKKNIKFQYYEVCRIGEDKQEILFDLLEWLDRITEIDIQKRKKTIKNITGRFEGARESAHHYYSMNFMRLDDSSNTYKVKEKEQAEHIDLEDDEYIGKNTVVLYDPDTHILMVQINRGGYGVSGIESYINAFNDTNPCYLRPIIHTFDIAQCLRKNVAKLDVRFANTSGFKSKKSIDFEGIIRACNNMKAVTAHIEIGLGRSKIETLNQQTIYDAAEDIRANKDHISSARIKIDDDKKSTIFDMFENIEHDFITFTIPHRKELGFEYISDQMDLKYFDSIGRITNNL